MFHNRISSVPTRSRFSKPPVACRSSVGFALVSVGGQGVSIAAQMVYQTAFDDARRQLSLRSALTTWNWRNN